MEGSLQAAVTPGGVRDGDPAVLQALVARRGPAVLAFCETVCEPRLSAQAAAEAFARFRALVATVGDTTGIDPEVFLLGATRHAAASMARPPADDRGVLRVLGRGASPVTTAALPSLLAARADDMLGPEDLERLSRLLERSAGCRETEAAFRRAERGYRSPPDRPVPAGTLALVVAAMQAAAPVAPGFAVLPAPPGPEPATESGTWPEPESPAATEPEPPTAPEVEATSRPPAAPEPPVVPVAVDLAPDLDAELLGSTGIVLAEPVVALDVVPADEEPGPEPETDDAADAPAVPAAHRRRTGPRLPHGGGLPLPRTERGGQNRAVTATDHGPVYQLVLPAAAIVIAVLVMLAIAGVFGGAGPVPAGLLLPAA